MANIEETIDVQVPVRTAYNQWTQFEEFPNFMDGVDSVEQLDDKRLHWRASFGGKAHEWDATITEQEPDNRIAWRDIDGKFNSGLVTFEPLAEDRTRVRVQMNWQAEGLTEKIGQAIGSDERRVKGDLERFKELIESRGSETGAWRGHIHDPSN